MQSCMEHSGTDGFQDSLPEWSKGVDSSSTSASCVGSNPTAVIFASAIRTRANARERSFVVVLTADIASLAQLAEHALRKRMVAGSIPAGGFFSSARFAMPCNIDVAIQVIVKTKNDPGRTRTCNPRLRRPMPYPLGHGAICIWQCFPH